MDWQPIETAPEKMRLRTKCEGGDNWQRMIKTLIRFDDRWWWPTPGFHVNYTPTHWMPVARRGKQSDHYSKEGK